VRRLVAGAAYVAAVVVLAAVAAWPIYRSVSFLVLVIVASALGAGVAALVTFVPALRRAGAGATAGLLAVALLLAGVPLAVPGRLGDAAAFAQGLGELGAGLVVGWKDLLTVDLPVGSYRNLLVPALVVFLVGTAVALRLAWRPDALAVLAVPVGVAMTGFGLLFGRTEVSAPVVIGPVTLQAPLETAVGLCSLAAGVLWLAWRTRDARVEALRTAARSSGVRVRRATGSDLRRTGIGVGMVAVAVIAALAVPAGAASAPRDVLRASTGPRLEISRSVSPLAAYRAMFTDAAHDQLLFSATGAHVPERIRLAVLDSYDGAVYRTDAGADASSFVRVASSRHGGDGETVDTDIVIGLWDGIWMPSAGTLTAVTFVGTRAPALADGFYVDDALSAAVQTAGWRAGDSYRLQAVVPPTQTLAQAVAPGGTPGGAAGAAGGSPGGSAGGASAASASDGLAAPASLRTWMQEHVTGTGGAALEGLVALLRERGYLSHALTDTQKAWMADAGVDTFVPSAAGHSLARIDQLFTALLDREQDPRAQASGDYVAAVGDDEQFAVAVALLARELGFPARIVVGARTASTDPGVTVCESGSCRAADLSAWVEVRSDRGEWIPVDATPQHVQPPSREVTAQPDPTIGTEVRPDAVEEVEPPKPAQEDAAAGPDRPAMIDLSALWATLRVTGTVLAVLALVAGPFLLVIAAKALRRRTRRTAGGPRDRIAGGWDEYLDAAADAGRPAPVGATRLEVAQAWDAPAAARLADGADAAVFAAEPPTDDDAERFWQIVDAERADFGKTRWQRVRAAVSLRSFVPGGLRRRTPVTDSPSDIERGSRARGAARRTA